MPRPRNPFPTPRCHKGRAVVDVYDGGVRRTVTLGEWGSPEANQEFARLMAERQVNTCPSDASCSDITVNEILLAFMEWAVKHYRKPDGELTTEVGELRWSLRPVRELYGHTIATEFGPRALAAIVLGVFGLGWARTLINRRIDRIKRVFKWATTEELVAVAVYQALRTLSGLKKGRTDARESEPVKPADPAHVNATLPFLTPHLQCMVELQRLTGMRPGEVCQLRLSEVERHGPLWVFRPSEHKTAHHGKTRAIFFGPRAQAVITTFLRGNNPPPAGFDHIHLNDPQQSDARLVMADAYQEAGRERDAELLRDTRRAVVLVGGCVIDPTLTLFSPFRAREERFRGYRQKRKSKVQPSQISRRKTNPQRLPAAEYTPHTFSHAVRVAAQKASVPHWHPNQLRHLFATEVRKERGLEAAQVMLGHSRADVTQIYAERNERLAADVAVKMG